MKKVDNSPRSPPSLPEVAVTLQEDSSIPEKINLSIDEEKRRLQEENYRLLEEVRQKDDELKELEDDSVKTLNSAFVVLRRFPDVIDADDFIEDSRLRIQHARPEDRVYVIRDVLRSTSTLIDVIEAKRWGH